MQNLKLNWHFTNHCNMHCAFCYAAKDSTHSDLFAIAKKLKDFKAINLVGGEPTLHKDYNALVEYLSSFHTLSVVSNGSIFLKDNKTFMTTLRYCETIGISIDSINPAINIKIGRRVGNKALQEEAYLWLCEMIKKNGKRLKINTVVNTLNKDDDMNDFIQKAQPDVWKIFQVLPIDKLNTKDMCITDSCFRDFIHRHKAHFNIMQIEDNICMTNSYIMLDSLGRFFNNVGGRYVYSSSILDICVKDAFDSMGYNLDAYKNRYMRPDITIYKPHISNQCLEYQL